MSWYQNILRYQIIGQLEKAECIFLYFTCSDSTFSGRANTAHVTASSQPGNY